MQNDEKNISPEVPNNVLVLTAGVDIGERSIHADVVGWAKGRESYGIRYIIVPGDPHEREVWNRLDQELFERLFTTGDGKKMQVKKICVDAGYASDHVYAYTKKREPRVVATKGHGGMMHPLIKNSTWTKTNRATLIHLGVDAGKQEIANRLRVSERGAGYCHFPQGKQGKPINGYDEEYFKGLRAEQRIVRHKLGFRTFEWVKRPSQRNEPFDCRVLALAALVLFLGNRNLDELARVEYVPPESGHSSQFGARQMDLPDNIERVRIRKLRSHDTYAYGAYQVIKLPGSASGFGAINPGLDF